MSSADEPARSLPARPVRSFHWRSLAIVLCAAASLGLYLLLPKVSLGLALAEPSFAGEVFGWVGILNRQSLTALQESGAYAASPALFLSVCAGLFGIYGVMLKLVKGRQPVHVQALAFGAGAVFLMVHLLAPIMLSTDVYAYAIYGRVSAIYGANPYGAAPPISPSDPFMPLFGQPYLPSWYGPFWTVISAGLAWLSGERVGLTVLLFRGLAVLAALAAAALLWDNLRRSAPERAIQGLVLFLWNPLLIIETGLSGHNDAVMLAFVLFGLWLHLRGCKAGAVVALTLSALVKFLTGMLIPLYVWMVLRQAASVKERASFIARSVLGAGAISVALLVFSKASADVPASHAALAPDFYAHNFHELIFKGLRRGLGEDAESIRVPIHFQGWWIAAATNTEMRDAASPQGALRRHLRAGEKLLVIAPQQTEWSRVYDPLTGQRGYAESTFFVDTIRPAQADTDPVTQGWERLAMDRPTVRTANAWVRGGTWLLFAAFGLLAAWRTTDFQQFLVWSAAALLASYYLIITEIWPWYINWALAVGAMAPTRLPAKFAVLLSASVLTLYVTIGYEGSDFPWVYNLRSLPAFVLPLMAFVLLYFRQIVSRPCQSTPTVSRTNGS